MADQGKWFKLHCGWDEDPHIDSLSLEDQARWCKFGTYMKEHGTEGRIIIVSPARTLQARFRVSSFQEVISCLERLPSYVVEKCANVTVSSETSITVSCKNWWKYQGDFSTYRVRKFRANETAKRRREKILLSSSGSSPSKTARGASPGATPPRPRTVVDNDNGNGALGHHDFLAIGQLNSAMPHDEFGWDHLMNLLDNVERVQSKMREKFYGKPVEVPDDTF